MFSCALIDDKGKRDNCVFQGFNAVNRFKGKSVKMLWHLTRGRVIFSQLFPDLFSTVYDSTRA